MFVYITIYMYMYVCTHTHTLCQLLANRVSHTFFLTANFAARFLAAARSGSLPRSMNLALASPLPWGRFQKHRLEALAGQPWIICGE